MGEIMTKVTDGVTDLRASDADPQQVRQRLTNLLLIMGSFQRKTLDANRYATKKTIAQGLLDVALLTANASQLKYVLQVGRENHPFYDLMLALIITSIVLQVRNYMLNLLGWLSVGPLGYPLVV